MIGLSRLQQSDLNHEKAHNGILFEENVFGLQVAMYNSRFVQEAQTIQELGGKHAHKRCAQASELVLLD